MYFRFVIPALLVAGAALAQPNCSQDTVRGYYGYWSEGTIFAQQPGQTAPVSMLSSQICAITIDGQGKMTGSCTASVNGQIMQGTITGNVTINPDCTATVTFSAANFPGKTATSKWIIMQGGDVIKEQTVAGLLGQPVGVATYQRISRVPPF